MLPLVSLTVLISIPTGPIQALVFLALLILCAINPWPDLSPTLELRGPGQHV
jgi:hypothetical protein